MDNYDFHRLMHEERLTAANRPLRLRLPDSKGVPDGTLLPQRISGSETLCGGFEYRVACVSMTANLPLKELMGLPAEVQIVTDSGDLRLVCGFITEARAGGCDGAISTYQIVVRDAMAVMEKRTNKRVFMNKNEIEIIKIILDEWRRSCWAMTEGFEFAIDGMFDMRPLPAREFVMQYNESDAAFLRRLMKRCGILWCFYPGRARVTSADPNRDPTPVHTLRLSYFSGALQENKAGAVRYNLEHACAERDTVTAWCSHQTLQPGRVGRHVWNCQQPNGRDFDCAHASTRVEQGEVGNGLAAMLDDYQIGTPAAGNDQADRERVAYLCMSRHDYKTKCYRGEGPLRDFCAGEYFTLLDHPEIDRLMPAERRFIITELSIRALNNLPKDLAAKAEHLFAANLWTDNSAEADRNFAGPGRVHVLFTAVRHDVNIVPAFDPRVDVPHAEPESAIVVGPEGEEVYCDEFGRVQVRFPGTRTKDHEHAQGAGARDAPGDSAWIGFASNWAGTDNRLGSWTLPRVGTEVLILFLAGDPDRPIIIAQLYNAAARPPALIKYGSLPADRYLAGMRSHEVHGRRGNQLRFDDTTGRISAQLASDHGTSELNLGWLAGHKDGAAQNKQRGEGAELRSDMAVAVRGDQGVLISAEGGDDGQGEHLGRAGLLGLSAALKSVADELAALAATHSGDEAATPHLANLVDKLKQWNGGAQGNGQPIVAVSAPAGMVLGSQANLALGAETKVDILCAGDTELSTGKSLFMRAARGISMFAYKIGIKLIAARGDVVVQTHEGNVEIKSSRRITLTAAEGIDLQAPEIKVLAQGAQTDWGGGAITHQNTGAHVVKSASFGHVRPAGGSPPGVTFPSTVLKTDERVVVRDRQTFLPVKGRRYSARHEDGSTVEGVTDDQGRTNVVKSDAMGEVEISLHSDTPEAGPTTGSTT